MRGLDLARSYFEEFGKPLIEGEFAHLMPYLAVGLVGSGSECLGYDDDVSRDHDFEPGFCIFLPGEDQVSRRDAFLLERAYAKLPKEHGGLTRSLMLPVGGARRGVLRIGEFLQDKTGTPDGRLSLRQWLSVPEQSLLEVTKGQLFFDALGEMTRVREQLAYYPEDVRRKKLAGQLLLMAQSGQYNYRRCLAHGETGAAQLAVMEFASSCMATVFLLNRRYRPYYKWSFRAMRALPLLSIEAELLEYLITSDNEGQSAQDKYDVIEGIAADVIDALIDQGLTAATCGDLEKHATSVNDGVSDPELRNLHILAAV